MRTGSRVNAALLYQDTHKFQSLLAPALLEL